MLNNNITNDEKLDETKRAIIKLIKEKPDITQEELAKKYISRATIARNINFLKEFNYIIRKGSLKYGYYDVLKN